jgi:EpsI family protein
MTPRTAYLIALLTIVAAIFAFTMVTRTQPVVAHQPLKTFPESVGPWQGETAFLPPGILGVLKVDDYLLRLYTAPSGSPLGLYVGYWGSQNRGTRLHSPAVCLPGAGWIIARSGIASIEVPGRIIRVNRTVVRKDDQEQLVLYWYQIRGQVVAKELQAMSLLAWTALTDRRSDEALVRINAPIMGSPEQTLRREVAFIQAAFPQLSRLLPQ